MLDLNPLEIIHTMKEDGTGRLQIQHHFICPGLTSLEYFGTSSPHTLNIGINVHYAIAFREK